MVNFYGCYDFSEEWLLIEMSLNVASSQIKWSAISVPNDELDKDCWQCPYLEQYLNEDGTEKICETYDEPEEDVNPCRVAYFIYKDGSPKLQTPYGNFDLTNAEELPSRLEKIIEFEED